MNQSTADMIHSGNTILGIELGSTRIKAVLISPEGAPLASGGHGWENSLDEGIWTYPLEEVWRGVQACFADLQKEVRRKYGNPLERVGALGISGMMHGYLVFDEQGKQLSRFRTWRNNITEKASKELTRLFDYPIPQRWSIAHLYHAILEGEAHVASIHYMTTLAGYVHWKLTGQKVLGINDASGMFPVDSHSKDFQDGLLQKFDRHIADHEFRWNLADILPAVLPAGAKAGELTEEGARLLDPAGTLQPGIPLCPPEGDAGTGMVATNSVRVRTGNVSAGTSVFAMLVLEKELSRVHHEIDLVTTPDGSLVAMAHSNNCSSEYSAWINLFGEAAGLLGKEVDPAVLFNTLMEEALKGDSDCGGLLAYGYHSGEHLTGFSEGRPLMVRSADSRFTVANFIRAQLFTALCAMRTGLNILFEEEQVTVDEINGHGGFFKTPGVGERIMAAATKTPVSVLETAGEGGAWGIALLAAYMTRADEAQTLPNFLEKVFEGSVGRAVRPEPEDVQGFNKFFQRYHAGLAIEQAAVENLKEG